ncbi:ER6L2 protein, partial [Herpetotheres cachinnans]|nr:ER6L2 protein [Herpetotheres cachinnans]
DGVQEVAYIHSNQNVVGSSKAENRLSRWAVRDVFELKQFSQLPANVAVCTAKVKRSFWEIWESSRTAPSVGFFCERNGKIKDWVFEIKLCHVSNVVFLLDNYRRQFEEMVSHFNMGSVEELAEHIAKATSETRQKMLKEFYISKHPEMEFFFPVEMRAQASHDCEERELGTAHSRKRKSTVNFGRSKSRSSSAKGLLLSRTTETQSQQGCKGEVEQLHNDSYLQDVCVDAKYKQSPTVATQHIERRNSQAFKDFMASGSLSSKSEIIEVLPVKSCEGQQDAEGTQLPRKRSLSQPENGERKAQTCKKKSFVDLLGDTSVLNDLFRNDGNGPTESPRRFPSGQVEKSKERPKDFWDMLNEQNEESLRKLTDVAVIEKLCERAPHPPVTEEREVYESSLWKKNENFLWKKYSPDD